MESEARFGRTDMEPDETIKDEELVELTAVYNDVEANLIKSLLEEAGITCLLVSHVPHSVYPFTVNGLGRVRVQVLAGQLEAAQAILDENLQTPGDADDHEKQ
jgi:hypothetical protein